MNIAREPWFPSSNRKWMKRVKCLLKRRCTVPDNEMAKWIGTYCLAKTFLLFSIRFEKWNVCKVCFANYDQRIWRTMNLSTKRQTNKLDEKFLGISYRKLMKKGKKKTCQTANMIKIDKTIFTLRIFFREIHSFGCRDVMWWHSVEMKDNDFVLMECCFVFYSSMVNGGNETKWQNIFGADEKAWKFCK